MPGATNMISPSGEVVSVSDDGLAAAVQAGYRPEQQAEGVQRAAHEGELANYSGLTDTIKAGVLAGMRTATLGLSDAAYGDPRELRMLREAHPTATTAGTLAGIAATLPAGGTGALAETSALLPAGMVARRAAGMVRAAEDAGAVGQVAAIAKAGAYEGAWQGAGSYLSDVALEDKDLSAEGFLGSVGHGALWGGLAGGALGGIEKGAVAARRLFPRSAVGDAGAVEVAEQSAASALEKAADVGPQVVQAARKRLDEIAIAKAEVTAQAAAQREALRVAQAGQRLETQKALDAIRIEKAAARGAKAGAGAVADDVEALAPSVAAGEPPLAIAEYQGGKYIDINEYARTGNVRPGQFESIGEATAAAQRRQREIDAAIDGSRIEKPMTVYRGIGTTGGREGVTGEIKAGTTFTDAGYSSTSTDRAIGLDYATGKPGGTLLEIELPAGSRAYRVPGDGSLQESELLLPRGTTFETLSVREGENGVRIARVRPVAKPTAADHFAGAEDTLAREAGAADLAADHAGAMLGDDVAARAAAHDAEHADLAALADDVAAKEAEVRALLRDQGHVARPMDEAFALPPTPRRDLAQAYDDAIARLSGGRTRAESEAALAEAASAERAIFDDALGAGGARMQRAEEILRARAEAGVDHAYSAARRMERYGTEAHLPAVAETEQAMAKLGPQAATSSLEDLLRGTKAQLDRGATIGEVGAIGKAASAERQTWREFTKGKMGPYMKSEGGHAGAMARLSSEWKAYQVEAAAGGRFTGDAAKAVKVIGDYEKSVAELTRKLGDAAPADAKALGAAYDAAVERATSRQTRSAAAAIDDAAATPMPTRMTKEEIAAWKERARVRDEANAIKRGRRIEYSAETPDPLTGKGRFSSRTTTLIDEEGAAIDWSKLSPAERVAAREQVATMNAQRGMNRRTAMDELLDGKTTIADLEKRSGRPVTADEVIDSAREQHLGVIDDEKEARLRELFGERVIRPAETGAQPIAEAARARAGSVAAVDAAQPIAAAARASKAEATVANANAAGSHAEAAAIGGALKRETGTVAAKPGMVERAKKAAKDAVGSERFAKIADAAAALEAARSLGIPGIPDPHDIPVIGPLLSMYLKARAARAVWSRLGGRIPETVETRVAARSAELRDRAAHAVDVALGLAAKGARAAQGPASRAAAAGGGDAIMSTLFPGREGKRAEKPKNVREAAAMRASELAEAMTDPELLRSAVRAQVPTSDADLHDAIQAAIERKLRFLHSKAPPVPPPDPMNRKPAPISNAAATAFARVVRVAEDPVTALHDLAAGTLTSDQVETLQAVYPRLHDEIRRRVLDQVAKSGSQVPYRTRVRLSVLFGAALDPSVESLADLQAANNQPVQNLGMQPGQAAQPPAPSVAGAPNLVSLYQSGADRRAMK